MLIKGKDIEFCLRAAWQMSEQYKLYALNPNRPNRSVDTLLWVCQQYLQKNITVYQAPIPYSSERTVRGAYVAASDQHDILMYANMDRVWRRFIQCKEIFHVLIANKESLSNDIFTHLEEVTLTFPVLNSEPGCSVAWEKLAEAAAMEFLYPAAERRSMNISAVAGAQIDALAARYDIPRVYIETYCSVPAYEFFKRFEEMRVSEVHAAANLIGGAAVPPNRV